MAVNLSIKSVPDEIASRLKERAAKNHRSLQGELMAIIEAAAAEGAELAPDQLLAEIRSLGLATPAESSEMVRADREAH